MSYWIRIESCYTVAFFLKGLGSTNLVCERQPDFTKQRQNDRLGLKGSIVSPGLHPWAVGYFRFGFSVNQALD
jgi:hypothetical protein